MPLSKTESKILKGIHGNLRRGDITVIANKIGCTKEYVGMVLNPESEFFREDIVSEAVAIIAERKQKQNKLLQVIMTACY